MNKLDKQYTDLLQDILDNGVKKQDRTGTGTISVFGRQIRHDMKDGFPLLTTKKMPFKTIVTELLWFLRGDTNIKYLVDNNCHIWDGDAYKNYESNWLKENPPFAGPYTDPCLTMEEFINKIKTDDKFAKEWGELGPIYGKQWRSWKVCELSNQDSYVRRDGIMNYKKYKYDVEIKHIDQIQNLINDLKTNPDSRRLMVNAWNVGELDQMVLPPCHYGFQVYTRELSIDERESYFRNNMGMKDIQFMLYSLDGEEGLHKEYDKQNVPRRAISLMFNMRSVDTFLGLPFNIASYGLLLEIIAKEVNMVPDELIGNLGDVHLYSNHIEQAKEQIGRDYTLGERLNMVSEEIQKEFSSGTVNLPNFPNTPVWSDEGKMLLLDDFEVPRRTRQPFPLPTFDCPAIDEIPHTTFDELVFRLQPCDFYMDDYQSHPAIKAPLSN